MKKGMMSLVLVLVAATALWAGNGDAMGPMQQEDTFVWMGPQHGSYMGVNTADVTKDRLDDLKMKEETGVEVKGVDQDAPAGKAGIKEHDVIVSFNGEKVESVEQLRRMVREVPPGRQVSVGLMRMGQPLTVQLTLADRKQVFKHRMWQDNEGAMPPMPPMPPEMPNFTVMVQNTSRTGLMVENLTPQLAEFFGVKNGRGGVMVRSVEKGSVAEASGFKAGDVVMRIDKDPVMDMSDFRRALRSHSGATPFIVLRDKREQTVTMKLPEHRRGELQWDGLENLDVHLENLQPIIEKQQKIVAKLNEQKMKELQKQMEQVSKELEKRMNDIKFDWSEQ